MSNLPEKFPEYSIMYKTLTKRIKNLELEIKSDSSEEIKDIQKNIKNFKQERQKIKKCFLKIFLKI